MKSNFFLSLAAAACTTSGLALPDPSPQQQQTADVLPNCFPFGSFPRLDLFLRPPNMARSDWWCPQSMFYGFLGFSYAFQFTNQDYDVPTISADMFRMKQDFGATMIRMYIPESYNTQMWENVLEAAVLNNMGLMVQVAFPISGNDLSLEAVLESTLFEVLSNSRYASIAPYIIHSAEYLNEPVGDCDKCAAGSTGNPAEPASLANLTSGLAMFRQKMNSFEIPAGISEDWDRPNLMSGPPGPDGLGVGLGVVGAAVAPLLDVLHVHDMAYYHNIALADAWNYTMHQVLWYKKYLPQLPLLISEMMWASGYNVLHSGGDVYGFAEAQVSVEDYTTFWKTVDANCAFMKQHNTAWFIHAWREEGTLDMLQYDGTVVIPNWKPKKWC